LISAPLPRSSASHSFGSWVWLIPGVCVALIVAAPIFYLFLSWGQVDQQLWQHLLDTQLLRLISNTVILVVAVAIGTTLVGVSLAWLTALCDFPGRAWMDWALMLPLAIPPYVFAFVVLGIFDFGGVFQNSLGRIFPQYIGGDARSTGMLVLVMTSVLYPYVYLLTRNIFLMQGRAAFDVARSLGASPFEAAWRVALPMARPGIIAGVSLVMMETLADFGAVSVFNYDTFTTAIYKSWISLFSLATASQLASLLLLFVISVIMLERTTRGRGRIEQKSTRTELFQLKGIAAVAASGWCLLVLALAFALPVAQLISWVANSASNSGIFSAIFSSSTLRLIQNTFVLALGSALAIVAIVFLINLSVRQNKNASVFSEIAGLGYALPGSVLAVGIVAVSAHLDDLFSGPATDGFLVGGLLGLFFAYLIRFYRPANSPIESAMARLRPELGESAQSLGASKMRIAGKIYLPMLTPGILAAMLLAMIDIMKEMPATLMLRPFGWDTLATQIYSLTSEAEWQRAAAPALILIAVSCVPVIMLIRQSLSGNR
jgi:iron(III) transport system permease protein